MEIPYSVNIKKGLLQYKQEAADYELKVSGLVCELQDLTEDKLIELIEACRGCQGHYIVLSTMNCEAGVLEKIIANCAMKLADYKVPIFIENGCRGNDISGYFYNAYSDVSDLISIIDYCKSFCKELTMGICYNIGYANLLEKNISSQLRQCGEYLCIVHGNDNDGRRNDKQMPYTFTKGRGDLTTDWYHIIRELIHLQFHGWFVFDTAGLFGRCPERLHTYFIRLLHAIAVEWEKQYTFAERVLAIPGKKLILFGAGQMLKDYMRVFGENYPPYFAVDNGPDRWNTEQMGVSIKNPQEILSVPEDERNVVICCMYYDAVGAQLRKMGVAYEEFHDRYFV